MTGNTQKDIIERVIRSRVAENGLNVRQDVSGFGEVLSKAEMQLVWGGGNGATRSFGLVGGYEDSAADESYDAVDFQNMFLAKVPPDVT